MSIACISKIDQDYNEVYAGSSTSSKLHHLKYAYKTFIPHTAASERKKLILSNQSNYKYSSPQ